MMREKITQILLVGSAIVTGTLIFCHSFQMLTSYLWDNPGGFLHEEVLGFPPGMRGKPTNYLGPPFIFVRDTLLLGALIAGWNFSNYRKWLIFVIALAILSLSFSFAYISSRYSTLFIQPHGNYSTEELNEMGRQWVAADKARYMANILCFVSLVTAALIAHIKKLRQATVHSSSSDST